VNFVVLSLLIGQRISNGCNMRKVRVIYIRNIFQICQLDVWSEPKLLLMFYVTIWVLGFNSRLGLGIFSSPLRPERLWGPPSLLSNRYQVLFPWGQSGRGVKLTTHLHLVPRSKMRRAIPPLPQYVFMAWFLVKHKVNFTLP
jgi:hypothetical protein